MGIGSTISKHKEWLFSGLGLGVIGLLWWFLLFVTHLTNAQIASALWSGIASVWHGVASFAVAPVLIKRWLLVGLPLGAAAAVVGLFWVYAKWLSASSSGSLSIFDRTELTRGHNIYRWQWKRYSDGTYVIGSVAIFCADCEARYVDMLCPICNRVADPPLSDDRIHAIVEWEHKHSKRNPHASASGA
jgi:hypothetical protein